MRPQQDCITGKRRYQTTEEAKLVADSIGNMHVYKCSHCKGRHLTKQSPESRAVRGLLTPSQKRKETRRRAKRRNLVAKVIVLGEDDDSGGWFKRKKDPNTAGSHSNRNDPGKNKDDSVHKRCIYGPWGLKDNRTEIRACKHPKCSSTEERPHSCAKNRCLLHPDNQ